MCRIRGFLGGKRIVKFKVRKLENIRVRENGQNTRVGRVVIAGRDTRIF
jgi:hypothetical protein